MSKRRKRPAPQGPAATAEMDLVEHGARIKAIIEEVRTAPDYDERVLRAILRRYPRNGNRGGGFYSKSQLVAGYRALCNSGTLPFERTTLARLQLKPVRTQSGVAPVAVLTRPAGCPGRCIFCPNDPEMPKSYLSLEPGAQRALRHKFDPYEQTLSRVQVLHEVGHPVDKIELLILGGTWSAYPVGYTEWFVKRCLDALNGVDSTSLMEAQKRNERARHRCVGLTIETRPDWITPEEILRLRRLGVTRVQVGAQSLDDRILELNRRGHNVASLRRACRLLRAAGFKIHLHWMPNLLGATPATDLEDFSRIWSDPNLCPDELKVYPCSLLEGTELYKIWQQGGYQPYDEETLVDLLANCKTQAPRYCRLSRIIRDIPATYIVAGNRLSNLREAVQSELRRRGQRCECIRCREVRARGVHPEELHLRGQVYQTAVGSEHFLSLETKDGHLAGFVRLLLPMAATGTGSRSRPEIYPDDCGTDQPVARAAPSRRGSPKTDAHQPPVSSSPGHHTEMSGLQERLASPEAFDPQEPIWQPEEIRGEALIREVHVYGPALQVGQESEGAAQHAGIGTRLVEAAKTVAQAAGYRRLAVIAAVGTRDYYRARGFQRGDTYMHAEL